MDKSTILPGVVGGGNHPATPAATSRTPSAVPRAGVARFPPLRPDGTALRSWRARAPMPPEWRGYLVPVAGRVVARRREELGLGGQRALADLLTTREYVVHQPEVSDLEHGGTYINEPYLVRLAAVLALPPEDLIDAQAAPADAEQEAL